MSNGAGGYLNYDLCVANNCVWTTPNASSSNHWQIVATNTAQGILSVGDPIQLQNSFEGEPLSTENQRCGDLQCVNGDPAPTGSPVWRFVETQSSVPAQTGTGWCRTTDQPGYIVKNDASSLYWDVFGNLTLHNDAGFSTLTTGRRHQHHLGRRRLRAAPRRERGQALLLEREQRARDPRQRRQPRLGLGSELALYINNGTLSLTDCTVSIAGGSPVTTRGPTPRPSATSGRDEQHRRQHLLAVRGQPGEHPLRQRHGRLARVARGSLAL